MYSDATWGVYASTMGVPASGVVSLVGAGEGAASIVLQLDADGAARCVFAPNHGLQGIATEISSAEAISQWQLMLTQSATTPDPGT